LRKLLIVGGLGALVGALVRKRRRAAPDFTTVDPGRPQAAVEAMEGAADVPGGIRP